MWYGMPLTIVVLCSCVSFDMCAFVCDLLCDVVWLCFFVLCVCVFKCC